MTTRSIVHARLLCRQQPPQYRGITLEAILNSEHSPARYGQGVCNDAEPFVDEREAANFLRVSVRTMQRWRTEPPAGGPPLIFYKLGAKRVAYRLSDCSNFAESRSYHSTSEMDAT
jgi:hypothetical protein